jgi:transcriptional regulator with XRE-family HTH domain
MKCHPVSKVWLADSVQKSSRQDLDEEKSWRRHEAWGAWVKELREAKFSSLRLFAIRSDLSEKTLRDFEAGRREPFLFEAKKLSIALEITLDELATEKEPEDGWMALCEEQCHRRALIFRAREPQEGEIEALSREARLVWDHLGELEAAFKTEASPPPKRL